MRKYDFYNDYSEGAHPAVLDLLASINMVQEPGYGNDSLSRQAQKLILAHLGGRDADVHFVSGGTQANLIALSVMMKPHEAVIAAESAHINVHEAGAIEATGHKILTVPTTDGKLDIAGIEAVLASHTDEHMVKPKVVFVSQSTELGTVYTKSELEALSAYCRKYGLYLYLDGARLGSALMSAGMDLTLADIAGLVDMFYIGGTKNGALLGEAMVVVNQALRPEFRYYIKQRGGLLAKGRVLGAQFQALFTDDLYFDLAMHANVQSAVLAEGLEKLGCSFLVESATNQIFPVFADSVIARLSQMYGFYVWQRVDETHSAVRLVTSWATTEERVREFLKDVGEVV